MAQHAGIVGISRLVDEKLNLALDALSFPSISLLVALKLLVDLLNGTPSGGLVLIHSARRCSISVFLFILTGVFIIVVAAGDPGASSLDLWCLEGALGWTTCTMGRSPWRRIVRSVTALSRRTIAVASADSEKQHHLVPKVLDKLILMSRGCNSLRDVAELMNADIINAAATGDDVEEGRSTERQY